MPHTTPSLLIFAGSTRQQSFNRKLAHATAAIARDAGATVTLLELSDFDIPLYNADLEAQGTPADVIRLKEILSQHPAWIICTPEYNASYPALLKNIPFDAEKDFTPLGVIADIPAGLLVHPSLPVKNIKELVALAKAHPGQINYGTPGIGNALHVASEIFATKAATPLLHVPYKGAAPALQDVLAGQADMVCDPGIAFPHIRTGKVKLLAVVSEKRSPFFPDVPTVAEQGFKGANLDIWFGMWAPNGTPAEVIARLNREVAKALALPTLKARYADLGGENVALDTAEFKALLANEGKVLGALIRDQKITVE